MKLCPNCGMQMADTAKFCANCGTKAPAPQEPAAEPIAQEKSAAPKKHKLLVPIIIAAAVLALAVAAVLILVLGGPKEADYIGKYTCEAIKMDGMTIAPDSLDINAYIKLEEKGEGVFMLDEKTDIEWKIEDESTLILTADGEDIEADWEDGVIELKLDQLGKLWFVAKGSALPEKVQSAIEETVNPLEIVDPEIDPPPAEPIEPEVEPEPEPEEPEEPEMLDGPSMEPPVAFEPVVSDGWTRFDVSIVGAEHFVDVDGKDAIRVYYDFTNKSDETTYAYLELDFEVMQDGYEQQETYTAFDDDVPEYGNDTRYLRPGASIRCIVEYTMKADGGPVMFTLSDYYNEDERIEAEFDPANLPGSPENEFEIVPIADPQWIAEWSDKGTYRDVYEVFIDNAEVAESADGTSLIRVYFEFTNNSEEACSFWWCGAPTAYQDGIELVTGYSVDETEEEQNYSEDVAPGESIRAAVCFELISTSPVEIELTDYSNELGGLGAIYELNAE